MKEYIKPTIKRKEIENEAILAASGINIGISDAPATGPAMSKDAKVSDEEGNSSASMWED